MMQWHKHVIFKTSGFCFVVFVVIDYRAGSTDKTRNIQNDWFSMMLRKKKHMKQETKKKVKHKNEQKLW